MLDASRRACSSLAQGAEPSEMVIWAGEQVGARTPGLARGYPYPWSVFPLQETG